ncbi:hypothetical protein [Nocardioides donggukensis]|uniref:Uncharacterized protein n=1 Tax=Nocardioides donggukensis TaxID=2774019 RepID=A0A927K1S9_9ACTN|nr:hypothetical protein [Nocardioides donggukensis]MBD8868294.1 hypothetical protein [Nocardioides donggukensis]
MGLLDRLPGEGVRGVRVAVATGVVAALVSGLLAWLTWGLPWDGDPDPAPAAGTSVDDGLVRVVSRGGGFALAVPERLTGAKVGKGIRVARADRSMVITVAPGPRRGLRTAHDAAVSDVEAGYPAVRVERGAEATMGGRDALRSVGSLRRADGQQLVFSVTTTARGRRTWSAVMFADRDVTAKQLRRSYQPVLDGFSVVDRP